MTTRIIAFLIIAGTAAALGQAVPPIVHEELTTNRPPYTKGIKFAGTNQHTAPISAPAFEATTNTWSGYPTNPISLYPWRQKVQTLTPIEITGITLPPESSTNAASVCLSVENISSSNIWITIPANIRMLGGATGRTLWITNGTLGMLTLDYDLKTNGVFGLFY
jgi:hypothetical protein